MTFHKKWIQNLKALEKKIIVKIADNTIIKPSALGEIKVKKYMNDELSIKTMKDFVLFHNQK